MFYEVHTLKKAKAEKRPQFRMLSKVFNNKKEAEDFAKKKAKDTNYWFSALVFGSSVTGRHKVIIWGVVPPKYSAWKEGAEVRKA
jgi:hypothetical protein